MAYRGFTGRLPVGAQGFTGTRNQSQVGPGHLTHVEGAELDGGIITKDGGASKFNALTSSGILMDSFTKVMLHFDDLDAKVFFPDTAGGATVQHVWTAVGNAQIDTAQFKFNNSSILMDGTGDRLTMPDNADMTLGTADWTFDCWFNVNQAIGVVDQGIFASATAPYAAANIVFWVRWVGASNGGRIMVVASNGANTFTILSSTMFSNTVNPGWHHVAFVRIGTTLKLFIDGVQEGGISTAFTGAMNNLATAWVVGDIDPAGLNSWNGWIDEVRLSAGVARWGSTQTSVNGADEFTKVLMHFNGPDASVQMGDDHTGGTFFHFWTANGNAQLDTAQFKFGTSSLLLDGTGDFVDLGDHPDFTLGSGDFTIECWFNVNVAGGSLERLAGHGDATDTIAGRAWTIFRDSTNVMVGSVSVGGVQAVCVGTVQYTNAVNTGWHHLALVRWGDTLRLYIDGVQQGATAVLVGTINDTSGSISIGSSGQTVNNPWTGWIDEFRMSVGIARWTENFVPSTIAYGGQTFIPPNASYLDVFSLPSNAIGVDQDVRVLLHLDGTDASTTALDSSPQPLTFTVAGNAQIDTAQSRFGGASGLFDGAGDWWTTNDSSRLTLGSGNWTFHFWFFCNVAGGTNEWIAGQQDAGFTAASRSFVIYRNATNQIEAQISVGGVTTVVIGTSTYTNAVNVGWNHCALVRDGGFMKLYLNGVLEDTEAISGTVNDSVANFRVGTVGENVSDPWTGWLDEVVLVTRALWTGFAFTPPQAPTVIAGPGIGTPAGILAGFYWTPVSGAVYNVIYLNGGTILKDKLNNGTFNTTMKIGMGSPFEPTPMFIGGGGEDVGDPRKLFSFQSTNQVQVSSGNSDVFNPISTPPADWSSSFPTVGAMHANRMFAAGNDSDPHRIYYSALTDHELWTGGGAGSIPAYPGEGERIVGLFSFRGALLIYKYPRGIYILNTTDPSPTNWFCLRVTKAVGSLNQNTVLQIENDVAYLDRSFNVNLMSATQEFGDVNTANLSETADMTPFLKEATAQNTPFRVHGVWYAEKRQLWFWFCRIGSVIPNLRQQTSFEGLQQQQQTGIPPRFFLSRRDEARCSWLRPDSVTGVEKPVIGDDDGFIWLLDQDNKNKDGQAYAIEFQTGNMDLAFIDQSLATREKNGQFLEIVNEPRGDWDLTVDVFWDDVYNQTILYDMGGSGGTLGSFVLDTDVLGGDAPRSQRKRLEGSGRRLRLAAMNSGIDQDISLAEFWVSFSAGDERTPN